ncbi:MAG: ATP-binding protein [Lactobacillales bacterium]|nr:ATP-binding protein [Lactobacillales bacterium]
MYSEGRCYIMLLQFKFKNHKCFYDETILDLMATQEKRHINSTIDINGNKILPVIEIHGANASGKSSTLEALHFMFEMIRMSSRIDINKDLPTVPFAFSDNTRKENSEYEISISLNDYEYRYGFSMNKNGFEEEWLYKKKFSSSTKANQKIIFERINDKVDFGKSYEKYKKTWELFGDSTNLITNKLLVLSNVAIKEEKGILRDIYNYINKFNFRIESVFQQQVSIDLLNQNNLLYKKFQKIINEFDPCLLGIKIDELNDDAGNKSYKISGVHKNIDNNKIHTLIPLQRESDGTVKIFNIMPTILMNLEIGGLLCIDELDVKLHPLLFKKIVNMYKDKNINKNNAQLIYTAHSTFLFNSDDLRRDQLYLVEKDSFGKSRLYSLSEFRNLRVDADYEKKYLTGQFGAIPYENK